MDPLCHRSVAVSASRTWSPVDLLFSVQEILGNKEPHPLFSPFPLFSPLLLLSPLPSRISIHPFQFEMRFLSLTLLSATLAALVLTTDAQTEVQPREHPLRTLAVGPHPDSIEGRSLAEKRAYGCTNPGYSTACGNYCCKVTKITSPREFSRVAHNGSLLPNIFFFLSYYSTDATLEVKQTPSLNDTLFYLLMFSKRNAQERLPSVGDTLVPAREG